ncbi:MAG: 3-oxoacyl-[acyl-carrier-protein] synthase 3 [Nitrospirales bacterium]|nr:MAG: 3-oxoacyl-[acyl-carrier-protein] synthase 3 [Nitrospirales bacterium]
MNSRILGTGSYVPDRILTNADLEKMVETSDSWIVERTGIRERRLVGPGEACSDLATKAAEKALAQAGLQASQLDLIIVGTCTGDSPLPSTACLVQQRIGATRAAAFDLNAACCGFVYALALANSYVKTGLRYVLVIGAEVMSSITDWTDRNTCVLFGDGAGAVVVGKSEGEDGILSIHLHGDGDHAELIQVPGGGSRIPASEDTLNAKLQFVKMKGNETFKVAVKTMEDSVNEVLTFNHVSTDDVDVFVPHQANIRILKAVAQRLKFPLEKTVVNLDRFGNTSAASIPLALDEAVLAGRVRQGNLVLLAAFGAGLTWASGLIRW